MKWKSWRSGHNRNEEFAPNKWGRRTFRVLASTEYRIPFFNEMTRQEELQKEGWVKRFTTDEPRLSEAVREYRGLGFEVLVEPVDLESKECTVCLNASTHRSRTIYTRKST